MILPYHPLANIFPLIEGAEFAELVASIKANGLRDPIIVHDGMVLDGRNRQRACDAAEVDCVYQPLPDGSDPLEFVVDKNLKRRHLRDGQRALIAARLANAARGRRSDLKIDRTITRSEAAQLLNVKPRTVEWGATVKKHAVPELLDMVERAQISVSAAGKISRLSRDDQKRIVQQGPQAIVAEARKISGLNGRHGRSEYAILWKCVDAICDALKVGRLDKADIAASDLRREIGRVARAGRKA